MKPTLHNSLILELVKTPGLQRKLFRKKTIDAIKRTMGRAWNRYREEEYRRDLNFVPDAFSIDREDRCVTAYEVIVTHRIEANKLCWLADAWFSLDCIEWDFKVITVNQFGAHTQVDLCSEWHKKWQPEKPPEPEEPEVTQEEIVPGRPKPRKPRSNKVFWWETPC